jgi:hypothetical protein
VTRFDATASLIDFMSTLVTQSSNIHIVPPNSPAINKSTSKMTLSQNTADDKSPNGSKSINNEENQYLDLVREILESGERRPDRYGQKLQSKLSKGLTIAIVPAQEHTPSLLLDR